MIVTIPEKNYFKHMKVQTKQPAIKCALNLVVLTKNLSSCMEQLLIVVLYRSIKLNDAIVKLF